MEQQNNKIQEQQIIDICWAAPEFEKREKSPAWFLIIGVFALVIFAVALLMKNFIFAILILLAVFAVFIYAIKEPRLAHFKIDSSGIAIDEKLYSYAELDSFWIFYEPGAPKELSIKCKKWLTPLIKISIKDRDPIAIRQALSQFIPEEKQEESLADIIARSIGF